ncbi:hypothetical protein [Acidianus bottle-shaped virus 3 strain ABV3]|uniref:Uncharacterized protein n=1 Tax=Acidianus bottle-shaped virus 3 strain ABV3 TaxID=1732174 RepID=A0A0N9P6I4_9VIRU|nr:hypothetical protein AVU00_gp35 [Acidianus bottle-shaped virus 3 strain ABV3]ALG96837.1 hypothetical protein [Acidianus bottle-shaped virus 3 strain ABV3]
MAEFVGLADAVSDTIYKILVILYKILKFIFLKITDGLGEIIAISFEYFVKLIEQLTRFVFR